MFIYYLVYHAGQNEQRQNYRLCNIETIAACMKIPHNYPLEKRENRMEISKTGFGWKYASFDAFV